MKHYLGISAGYHDAAMAVVREDGDVMFAAHSERYSGIKNDPGLDGDLVAECLRWQPNVVSVYERPWMHNLQQWWSGQKQYGPCTTRGWLARYAPRVLEYDPDIQSWPHHLSHAAAGFQTSPFDEAAVVVIDAIGELDTISIYQAWYDRDGHARYKRLWRRMYPHSIGLFYSAITQACGLKPMEEEYITMGMSAYGSRVHLEQMCQALFHNIRDIEFRHNLHQGLDIQLLTAQEPESLAACAQAITEYLVINVMQRARKLVDSTNLVYGGGVALNCVANQELSRCFKHVWIMPNPGDAGSSLGAAALGLARRLNWKNAYLGHVIPGSYPVGAVLNDLLTTGISAVASGAAEFGPRALGNRSLLADPRDSVNKQTVNQIKRRQQFRPFAPAILEEHAQQYFRMPDSWPRSPYMQVVAQCRQPKLFPAITHVDGSSRVQTVPQDGSGFRRLLEAWYDRTGCPMLLNTSLNIRGEPMVNDREDADRFQREYGVLVRS